jgi:AcrR family transcriptional regulator
VRKRVFPRPRLLSGEDLLPKPRQQRSREGRERIQQAALALFSEKGYEGTSIHEIAARADLAVGGFYLHFRSKRQLLLALMDELLEGLHGLTLSALPLQIAPAKNIRWGLRSLLLRAFDRDLRYLGAYRAWQDAVHADAGLQSLEKQIRTWTSARVYFVFEELHRLPGARPGIDLSGLASAIDSLFWSLLGRAAQMRKTALNQALDAATHLIYHALFAD